jgi:hypothetical protein
MTMTLEFWPENSCSRHHDLVIVPRCAQCCLCLEVLAEAFKNALGADRLQPPIEIEKPRVPDVQISRFRFFMEELCSRGCSDGRSGLPAEVAPSLATARMRSIRALNLTCDPMVKNYFSMCL